jgi:hypothetical protein
VIRLLALLYFTLHSDLARQYALGKEPGLVSGTAAANAAGSGVPETPGQEKATSRNSNIAHDFKTDLGR